MENLIQTILSLFTSPLILLLIVIVAIVLAIVSLASTLLVVRKLSEITAGKPVERPKRPAEKPKTVEKPEEEKAEGEVIRIAGGFESLEEFALLMGVDSAFLFSLSGMAIDSYNMKEEENVAASLAEFVLTLRKLGFPTETVTLKNGMQTLILSVQKVGDMEIYALMLGKSDLKIDIEEARQLLQTYVSDLVKGKRGGEA